jgi:hypothetical protein
MAAMFALSAALYAYLVLKSKGEAKTESASRKMERKARKNARRERKMCAKRAAAFEIATTNADTQLAEEMEDSPFNETHWQEGAHAVLGVLPNVSHFQQ